MIHLKQACDTRRTKKDGTHPIIFRITLQGKSRDISTGLSCTKQEWNKQKSSLKIKNKELEIIAERLGDKELILLKKIRKYESDFPNSSNIQDVKNYLQNKVIKLLTVEEFWGKEIARLNQAQHYGNARNYSSALGGILLKTSLNITFEKIDYKWLVGLETKLRKDGLKQNSISTYMRKLKSMYNRAINYGIADANNYPFRRYRVKSEVTTPRVASIEELQKFFTYNGSMDNQLYHIWNFGRLMFMLRGINYVDLSLLTHDNIKHSRIVYRRSKTHKLYSIKLLPLAEEIINSYRNDERKTLLPILTNQELINNEGRMKRIMQQRKNFNKYLRRLGQELSITENLSSYVFRYSYANACKKLGYSKDMIGEALGHSVGSAVTGIYLQDYDLDVIDEMNATICNRVIGGV